MAARGSAAGSRFRPARAGRHGRQRIRRRRPGRLPDECPQTCPLPAEVPQALIEDAGTERGGGTTNDSLGDGVLVLGAELPGRRYDRVRRRVKSLGERPGAARGIVEALDDSGGDGNWRCGDGDGVGPESTRLLRLHLQLLSHGSPETTRLSRKYRAALRPGRLPEVPSAGSIG